MIEHETVGSVAVRTRPPVGADYEFENRAPLASMPPSLCEKANILSTPLTHAGSWTPDQRRLDTFFSSRDPLLRSEH